DVLLLLFPLFCSPGVLPAASVPRRTLRTDPAWRALVLREGVAPQPMAKPSDPLLKGGCSASADCADGSTISCSAAAGAGTCSYVDQSCPDTPGSVTCGSTTKYCPTCLPPEG